MKKHSLLILVILFCTYGIAVGKEFVIDDLKFAVTSEETREVSVAGTDNISGDIMIPATVEYEGIEYSVTSVASQGFTHCNGLTSIAIPEGITLIEWNAFFRCENLTSVSLPESLLVIEKYGFYGCRNLNTITIPQNVTSIGMSAFTSCGLSIIYSMNPTPPDASDAGFNFLSSMDRAILCVPEDSVDKYAAAEGWSWFHKIYNINSLYQINDWAIIITSENNYEVEIACYNGSASDNIVIPDTFELKDVEYTVTSIGSYVFYYFHDLVSISIPENVTSIGELAFYGCTSLNSVLIPKRLTFIGDYAFGNCSKLSSFIAPQSLTCIGDYAFCECRSLTAFDFPESVTSIGDHAFYFCDKLTSVNIPQNVTSIGNSAFMFCKGMTEISVSPDNKAYVSYNKSLLTKDLTILMQVPAGFEENEYMIPESVTTISDYAFAGCVNLVSITITEGVNSIGSHAFSGCWGLLSLTIPESVTSIGDYAFSGCRDLTSITLPPNLTSIGEGLFYSCTSLSSVTIPESVISIGDCAFYNCTNLSSINIPERVTSIGNSAFWCCDSLSSVTIPGEVDSIGNGAFFDCRELRSITIRDGVSAIGSHAFQFCRNLTSIVLPESIIFIGNYAFGDCYNLSEVCSMNPEAPESDGEVFSKYPTIYVPKGSIKKYKDAFVWCHCEIREIKYGSLTLTVLDESEGVEGATLSILDQLFTSDENGVISVNDINISFKSAKQIPFTVFKEGYDLFEGEADFSESNDVCMDVSLVNASTSIRDVLIDHNNGDTKAYDLNGRPVNHLQNGRIYIINGKKIIFNQ